MTSTDIERDAARIREAVAKARSQGWTIVDDLEYPDCESKCCCPMSALAVVAGEPDCDCWEAAEAFLGWDSSFSSAYANGFDGHDGDDSDIRPDDQAFLLGKAHRRELLEAP